MLTHVAHCPRIPQRLYHCLSQFDNLLQYIYQHRVRSKLHTDPRTDTLMSITVSDINFIRLFTKAFFWGIYLVSLFICLRWLVWSDDGMSLRKSFNRPMLAVTIILFAFSLTDFGLYMYSTVFQGAYTWSSDIIVSNLIITVIFTHD